MARYKVSIEKIFPNVSEDVLMKNKECIVGISMSNPVYWRSSLNDILKWTSENFNKTHLVVADFLNRFNEALLNNEPLDQSELHSIAQGDKFMLQLNKYMKNYSQEKFNIIRWIDLIKEKGNMEAINDMHNIYDSNRSLKDAIDMNAINYIKSQERKGKKINVSTTRAQQLSSSYLLEELAVFNKMIGDGCKVIIYPGAQLSIFKDMADGHFSEMSEDLKNGIYVQLKVTKR